MDPGIMPRQLTPDYMRLEARPALERLLANVTGPASAWDLTFGPTPPGFRFDIGFLQANTTYTVRIQATTQTQQQIAWNATVTTPDANPWPPIQSTTIQPGLQTHNGVTLGFLLRDPTNETLYFLGTGHSFTTGDLVYLRTDIDSVETEAFGTVIDARSQGNQDWALIEVTAESRQRVHPQVAHWTGPTATASPDQVSRGEVACLYGNGRGLEASQATKPRCGPITGGWQAPDGTFYGQTHALPTVIQDSGSPVIDYQSGQAIGMLIGGVGQGASIVSLSAAICPLLSHVWEAGHPVMLATAKYQPPPQPIPHLEPLGQRLASQPCTIRPDGPR